MPPNTTPISTSSRRTPRSTPSPPSSHHQRSQLSSRDQINQPHQVAIPVFNIGLLPNKENSLMVQVVLTLHQNKTSTSSATTSEEVGELGRLEESMVDLPNQQQLGTMHQLTSSGTPSVGSEPINHHWLRQRTPTVGPRTGEERLVIPTLELEMILLIKPQLIGKKHSLEVKILV
jgi:hypothetical protein